MRPQRRTPSRLPTLRLAPCCHRRLAEAEECGGREQGARLGRNPASLRRVLVGNKADLLQHRQVTDSDHVRFWQERKLEGGFLTSARSGENVAKAVYATAAHSVGVDLTAYELAFHDRVLNKVDVASAGDAAAGGRTADADRIEEEDRLAELRKRQRASCSCALS